MQTDKEIINFLKELHRVMSKFGSDKVLNQIRKLHLDSDDVYTKDVCNYIIVVTSNKYKISLDDLMYSNKRASVSKARKMCFALMKEHLSITDEEIGGYFGGKARQYVNNQLSSLPINKDSYKDKSEEIFVKEFIELSTDVLFYTNSYEIKTKDYE
jgi:chromosomal replication initiation ATPase DnaA